MSEDILINSADIIKEGWIQKQSLFFKNWRRRWLVLTNEYLCTFPESGKYAKPTEYLRLRDCSTVKSADDDVHKEFSFRVDSPQRVFFLVADSPGDREAWIGQIGAKMVRPSVLKDYDDDNI
eukprot:GHVU01171734.1.p1 GENE.GHVU01171734.1~~GHVU01171734.1.p1  ORF type:complete len:122 (+),score=14.97 GHVU01171734.1:43-408(+)